MFLGQFYHNLDEKGRLTVPARFRDLLAAQGGYVIRGFDRNLMVILSSSFEKMHQDINQMSMTDPTVRSLRRLWFSGADQVEVDKAGRILISQNLRQWATIEDSVVIVGNGDYFEIWSPEAWAAQATQLQDAEANAQKFAALTITSG